MVCYRDECKVMWQLLLNMFIGGILREVKVRVFEKGLNKCKRGGSYVLYCG